MKIPKIELTIEEGLEMAQDFLRKKEIVARVIKLDTDGYPLKGYVIECEGRKEPMIAPEPPYEHITEYPKPKQNHSNETHP